MLDASSIVAPDGKTLKVRASMGAAFYPEDATDFAHLREYADFAMYLAKSSRKGICSRSIGKATKRSRSSSTTRRT